MKRVDSAAIVGTAVGILIAVPAIAAVTFGMALYLGAVLYVLWGWFLVPLGLPPISIPWAVGIIAVAFALHPEHPDCVKPEETRWSPIVGSMLRPLLLLGIGYLAHQFGPVLITTH